jgi:hypothetical protein
MSQEIGHVTVSHGMSLVVTLSRDCSTPIIDSEPLNTQARHKLEQQNYCTKITIPMIMKILQKLTQDHHSASFYPSSLPW